MTTKKQIEENLKNASKKKADKKPVLKKATKEKGHARIKAACKFGTVSFGDSKVSVPLSIDRKAVNVRTADENFCKARCDITMSQGDLDQQQLIEDKKPKPIKATGNIHQIRFDRKQIYFNMSFDLDEIPDRACRLSYCNGSVSIKRVGEAGEHQGKDKVTEKDDPQMAHDLV